MLTAEQKKLRNRANRSRRSLLKEHKEYGFISDGSGKRYRISVDYLLSGDIERAEEFIRWFEEQFPDDVGDPVFLLYSAITYFRLQDMQRARAYLLNTMLSNFYLLPSLFSKPINQLDMWHSSNWETQEYVQAIEGYLSEPTFQERAWFEEEFAGPLFSKIRNKYIATYSELKEERNVEVRRRILDEWRAFEKNVRANEI